MAVFEQMLLFFLLMGVGIYARKHNILTKENQTQFSAMVVNIAYPALILSGAMTDGEKVHGEELLSALAAAILLLVLLTVGGYLSAKLFSSKKNIMGTAQVLVIFSNIGFMGVPMIESLYGDSALIYMTIFLIPFNVYFFSYAIYAIKNKEKTNFSWHQLCNTGMIACVLSVVIYFSDISLPMSLVRTVRLLGSMTAPLAMMLLGAFLMEIEWKKAILDMRVWLFSINKMLIIPVVIIIIMAQLFTDPLLLAVCMAAAATPSGNVIPLLASIHNEEAYPLSVKAVAFTTLLSIVTMPVTFSFLTYLGHVD